MRADCELAVKKYLYRLYRGQHEVTAEFICQKHYDEASQPGRDMAPLSEREQRTYTQKVTEYTGSEPCAMCEEGRS